MNKFFLLSITISVFAINGCAKHAQIIIDPKGVDMSRYQRDLAECTHISQQVQSQVAEEMISGAVIGAIAGEIIGGNRTVESAQLGALSGGVHGGRKTERERINVVKNCLRGRGYQVLN